MRFFPYELKLKHVFAVASYSRTTTPDVQVEIEYEGVTGYGEASMPPYLGQTVDTVMAFLRKVDLEQFRSGWKISWHTSTASVRVIQLPKQQSI